MYKFQSCRAIGSWDIAFESIQLARITKPAKYLGKTSFATKLWYLSQIKKYSLQELDFSCFRFAKRYSPVNRTNYTSWSNKRTTLCVRHSFMIADANGWIWARICHLLGGIDRESSTTSCSQFLNLVMCCQQLDQKWSTLIYSIRTMPRYIHQYVWLARA